MTRKQLNAIPWTRKDYPESLKSFMVPVRNKAAEIVHALLDDGAKK